MMVLSFETKKSQISIFDKAVKYFVDDVGLKVTEKGDCCVNFADENQLGYIRITVAKKDGKFEVNVESREYDYHAKKFVSEFK